MNSYVSPAPERWPLGPRHPRLTTGGVHIWRADLDDAEDALRELLSTEEHRRAGGILGPLQRTRWARGRGLLRALLGRYLNTEPAALRLTAGPRGKPALDRALTAPGNGTSTGMGELSFNLAHSGGTALYAFSACGEVGVDVELARRRDDVAKLAEHTLGAAEARRLAALEPEIRQREFLRAWVRHEAALKCLGTGLSSGGGPAEGPSPRVAELDLGPHAVGALGTLAQPASIRCWRWPPSPDTAAGVSEARGMGGRAARRS